MLHISHPLLQACILISKLKVNKKYGEYSICETRVEAGSGKVQSCRQQTTGCCGTRHRAPPQHHLCGAHGQGCFRRALILALCIRFRQRGITPVEPGQENSAGVEHEVAATTRRLLRLKTRFMMNRLETMIENISVLDPISRAKNLYLRPAVELRQRLDPGILAEEHKLRRGQSWGNKSREGSHMMKGGRENS